VAAKSWIGFSYHTRKLILLPGEFDLYHAYDTQALYPLFCGTHLLSGTM